MSLFSKTALLPALSLGMASCSISETTTSQITSPDGQYVATLTVRDCGSFCAPSAKVVLHDPHNRIGKGDIEVFKGRGGWPIELHWTRPRTMVVTFCEGSDIKVRSDILESRLADEHMPWDDITVIVVNAEEVIVDGKAYCQFPDPPADPSSSEPDF